EFAHNHNILTLYNPAPARKLDQTIIDKVSYITPNETEFSVIFPGATFEEILRKYPNKLVVTLGDKGAIYFDGKNIRKVPAKKVSTIVDTTGAGDTFNAALAVSILEGKTMQECVEFANLASSIAIQSKG